MTCVTYAVKCEQMSGYQYADTLLEANYGFKESDIVKRLEQYTTLYIYSIFVKPFYIVIARTTAFQLLSIYIHISSWFWEKVLSICKLMIFDFWVV